MYNNTSLLLCCNIINVVQLFLELILISYRIICSNNLLMCNKYYIINIICYFAHAHACGGACVHV